MRHRAAAALLAALLLPAVAAEGSGGGLRGKKGKERDAAAPYPTRRSGSGRGEKSGKHSGDKKGSHREDSHHGGSGKHGKHHSSKEKVEVGDWVTWSITGDGGVFLRLDRKGDAVVKFSRGRKQYLHLPLSQLNPGPRPAVDDFAIWNIGDSETPKDTVGVITRFDHKGAIVKYPHGKKRHLPTRQLRPPEVVVNDIVIWSLADKEVPSGSVGTVMRFDSKQNAVVKFTHGVRKHIPLGQLRREKEPKKGGSSHGAHGSHGSHAPKDKKTRDVTAWKSKGEKEVSFKKFMKGAGAGPSAAKAAAAPAAFDGRAR